MLNKLWLDISEGSKDAYSELYIFYYRKFFNYGRKFTDDIPLLEDIIQEILLHIWLNRSKLPGISNPNAYYYTSFRNSLFTKMAEAKPAMVDNEQAFSIDNILIQQEIDLELKTRLDSAIKTLTPRQAEAIYLKFYEGFSYEEVAGMLNITVKATYKIVARALLQLKTNLEVPYVCIVMLFQIHQVFVSDYNF
jgi:RNA polymerase sigma factor (sigma-70 family)